MAGEKQKNIIAKAEVAVLAQSRVARVSGFRQRVQSRP